MSHPIACPALRSRITDADSAAALIRPGETIATSGFTGSGYPKAVPQALARRSVRCLAPLLAWAAAYLWAVEWA